MDETERPRSVRLPQWLWDELDRDAARCKRSSVKQLETLLTAYYRGTVETLDIEKLDKLTGRLTPTQTRTAPIDHVIGEKLPPKRKAG